jgi:hypothetical protein
MNRLAALLIAIPSVAFAEVMDKEPSFVTVLVWACGSAAALYAASRFKPWLLFVLLPAPALFFHSQISEVSDPGVGGVILSEAGALYVAISWAAPVVSLLAIGVGFWQRRKSALLPNNSLQARRP